MAVVASTGMRFFAAGVELVRKNFDELAQSGQKMWAGIASGHTKASPGMKAVNAASKEVQEGISGITANAGAAGRVLSALGPAGVAAAAGIGGVVLALHEAKKGMEDFGSLGELAKKIGVTTDVVQKWRFVVGQTGGTEQDSDAALKSFAEKFGGAQAGSQKSLKYFEALGLGQDDLKKLQNSSDALPVVTSRIAALKSQNEQLWVSGKLGIDAFLPAIREGQSAIDAMMKKAQEMGLIVDSSMIKRAKEAGDQYKAVASVIDIQLKKAFVDLAPTLIAIAKLLAGIAGWLGRVIDQTRTLDKRTNEGLEHRLQQLGNNNADLMGKYGVLELVKPVQPAKSPGYDSFNQRAIPAEYAPIDQARMQYAKNLQEIHSIRGELGKREEEDRKDAAAPATGTDLNDMGTDRTAAQDEKFQTAIKSAREKYLSALEKMVNSIDQSLDIALKGLVDEKHQRDDELARQVKNKALTQAQANQISAEEGKARDAKATQLKQHARLEKQKAAADYDDDMTNMAVDILRIQGDMEVTSEGRYEIQKQILEAERAQARKVIEQQIENDPNLTDEEKKKKLTTFDAVTKAKHSQLDEQQSGLRLAFRDSFRSGVHDALQSGNPFALLTGFFSSLADHFVNRMSDKLGDMLLECTPKVRQDK
jgi:hypothetical protein